MPRAALSTSSFMDWQNDRRVGLSGCAKGPVSLECIQSLATKQTVCLPDRRALCRTTDIGWTTVRPLLGRSAVKAAIESIGERASLAPRNKCPAFALQDRKPAIPLPAPKSAAPATRQGRIGQSYRRGEED